MNKRKKVKDKRQLKRKRQDTIQYALHIEGERVLEDWLLKRRKDLVRGNTFGTWDREGQIGRKGAIENLYVRVRRQWVKAGASDDVQEGRLLKISPGGRDIVLTRLDGRVFAVDADCPHRGGPLVNGRVCDGNIRCPLHGYEFELSSGRGVGNDLTLETIRVVEGKHPPDDSGR